jgi:hypothetical protein
MGYMMAFGTCASCKRTFGFNPHKVPSVRVNNTREPVCEQCFNRLNVIRKEKGLPEWTKHPDAYEAADESEL